jgi:peptide/nickel transport system substrate-binding protein
LRWGVNVSEATPTFSCCFAIKEFVVGERIDVKVLNPNDATAAAPPTLVFGRNLNRRDVMRIAGAFTGFALTQQFASSAAAQDATPSAAGQLFNPSDAFPSDPTGTLNLALQFDATNLDPAATYTLSNARWEGEIYSPLTWRDPNLQLYDGQEGHPKPEDGYGLAAGWEYTDDLTLKMTLKTGITFQNGEPFNANAVKATYDRMLAPDSQSPQAFNYSTISSVEVVDDATVLFHFSTTDPVMITKMAGYGSYIVPPEASASTDFGVTTAVGTGPYKLVEYVKDDHITFEAWDGWWGSAKPLVKTLNYRIIPDDNTRLAEFLAGNIDAFTLNVNQVSSAQGNPDVTLVEIGSPTVNGLRLDAKQAPTDNKSVRQAISHAIDLQTIIDTILSGYAKPVPVWQSPFSFGNDDTLQPYAYDPALAQQLVTESGLATPIKLTYDVIGQDTQALEIGQAVKGMLDAVGFDVELRTQEQATYFDDYRAGKLGNVVPFGWGGWTLDYDNTYFSMYKTAESYNPSYSNSQVDDLLDQERATLDQAARLDVAKQINQIIYDDAPDVALYQLAYVWGVNNRVKNLLIPPDDRFWLVNTWVEE